MATMQPGSSPDRDHLGDRDLGRPDAVGPGAVNPEPLWRELLGRHLRWLRLQRGETLAETARRAGISPQYLSEIERGIKEPSSEMVAAIAGALGATLLDLTSAVAWELTAAAAPLATVHRLSPTRAAARATYSLAA